MARATFEAWLPEEPGSAVLQKVNQASAIERYARKEPMAADAKSVPRSGGFSVAVVAKGAAFPEDTTANDEVVLTARKIGGAARIADEDIKASAAQIVPAKKIDAAASYAKFIDNAALGTTAAANGTTVPFESVYRAVKNNDSSAPGYTPAANLVTTAGALTYADFSDVLALVENGDYYDESKLVVIAHPRFKQQLRGLLDSQNRPLFLDSPAAGEPGTVFGAPVIWTRGAKTSATATDNTQAAAGTTSGTVGNPLFIVGNADHLILGVREGFSSWLSNPALGGPGMLTDEWLMLVKARRGFAVGHPGAFGVLEVTTA